MSKTIYIGGRLESKEKGNVVTGANAILDDTKGKKQNVINKETDDELLRLEQSKQDNLNFDNAPTEDSTNPVTSGGVYTAEKALSDAIEAILLLIPSAATALNKLVDTNTMNSSISTATATFRGTYNAVSDLGLTYQATHAQIEAALDALGLTADNNDFVFVQIPVSDQSQDIAKTERFKFNGTNWLYEYDLNTSGFTAAQWAAINSTITLALVQKLAALPTNAELLQALGLKQDVLTFDDAPTTDSNNPVKSGGIKNAIDTAVGDEATARENADTALGGLIGDEKTRAEGVEGGLDTRLGAVEGSVSTIQGVIPSEATSSNKLVDNSSMTTYIGTIIDNIDATFNVTSTDGHVTLAITQVNGAITSVQVTTSDIASAAALNLKASQADLTALAGRVTTAEGNITSLTGRMTTAESDIDTLTNLYNALQQSAPQVIQPTDTWPVTNPSTTVIYRVIDRVNTPPEYYNDYMWNGTSMVLMATYNNAVDAVPTAGSHNLVESGGVNDSLLSIEKIVYNYLLIPTLPVSNGDSFAIVETPNSPQLEGYIEKLTVTSPFQSNCTLKMKLYRKVYTGDEVTALTEIADTYREIAVLSGSTEIELPHLPFSNEICLGWKFTSELNLKYSTSEGYQLWTQSTNGGSVSKTSFSKICYNIELFVRSISKTLENDVDDSDNPVSGNGIKKYIAKQLEPLIITGVYGNYMINKEGGVESASNIDGYITDWIQCSEGQKFYYNGRAFPPSVVDEPLQITSNGWACSYVFANDGGVISAWTINRGYGSEPFVITIPNGVTRIRFGSTKLVTEQFDVRLNVVYYNKFSDLERRVGLLEEEISEEFGNTNIVLFGDSITWLGGDNCNGERGWSTYFKAKLNPKSCKSYARSGATMTNTENTVYDIVEDTGITTDNNVLYNQINRLFNDYDNQLIEAPDIIIIALGANDRYRAHALDDTADIVFSDMTGFMTADIDELTTFAKAMRYNHEMLLTKFPEVQIVYFTPLQSKQNSDNFSARVGSLEEQCAAYLSSNVLNGYKCCGIYLAQENQYYIDNEDYLFTDDGTHPSVLGARRIGHWVANQLKTLKM